MLCPSCTKENSVENKFCLYCGEPFHGGTPTNSNIPSTALPHSPSTELENTTSTFGKAFVGVVPLLKNIPKVVVIFAKNTIPIGVAGVFAGILSFLFFQRYLDDNYPDLLTFTVLAFCVVYLIVGGAVLWGYIGFLRGAERAIASILNEKIILESLITTTFGTVIEYIKKDSVEKNSTNSSKLHYGDIAIPYETLNRAFKKWDSGESNLSLNDVGEDKFHTKQNRGMVKLIIRFLMSGKFTKLILLQFSQFYKMNKGITFGELGGTIIGFADSAGKMIIKDLRTKRIILTSILIPSHLILPFVAVYLYWMLK